MKMAIMQPYFFPYPGYFELMSTVDLFVFFTDVQYIRCGWVNRNRIRSNTGWQYITVPVKKHKQKEKIEDIISDDNWVNKHLKTFQHVYGGNIDPKIIEFYKTLSCGNNLCDKLVFSLKWMCSYLEINLATAYSSKFPSELKGEDRILDLCKKFGAKTYMNLPGGKNLYNKDHFDAEEIKLEFMPATTQGDLSILDNCFNDKNSLRF